MSTTVGDYPPLRTKDGETLLRYDLSGLPEHQIQAVLAHLCRRDRQATRMSPRALCRDDPAALSRDSGGRVDRAAGSRTQTALDS
jgi:hypothetical protein